MNHTDVTIDKAKSVLSENIAHRLNISVDDAVALLECCSAYACLELSAAIRESMEVK